MDHLVQIILLLAVTVAVMVAFQRLHIPSSLGYLLVGLILGPHTVGPTVHVPEFKVLAEFGVVFLLFSIGLNYSLPQLHAMRHQILGRMLRQLPHRGPLAVAERDEQVAVTVENQPRTEVLSGG
jgi:Kef-type K+ transport system membrane component KefB